MRLYVWGQLRSDQRLAHVLPALGAKRNGYVSLAGFTRTEPHMGCFALRRDENGHTPCEVWEVTQAMLDGLSREWEQGHTLTEIHAGCFIFLPA